MASAPRAKQTLVQRIALEGGDDIKKELQSLGKVGEIAFNRLQAQADKTAIATTGFSGKLFELRSRADVVGQKIGALAQRFSFLGSEIGRAAGLLLGAFSINALVNMTSAWTDLNSRLAQSLGDHSQVADVMERLSVVARRTFSSIESTADGFIRNSVVLKELGFSTERQLDLQEALNNALVVSGAKGQRAEEVQTAITKAMSIGALRGEELNTVLQKGSRIAELLADHFNTTTGGLRALAEQGLITGEVLGDVLTKNLEVLRAEADRMQATIQDAFIILHNALLTFIGTRDEATGVSKAIADGIIFIADNIDIVVIALGTLVAGFLAVKAVGFAIALFDIVAAFVAMLPAITAVTIALATNPFGLLAIVLSAVLFAIIQATGGFENFFKVIAEWTPKVLEFLGNLVKPVVDFITAVVGAIRTFLIWAGLMQEDTKKAEEALAKVTTVVDDTNKALGGTTQHLKLTQTAAEQTTDSMVEGFQDAATEIDHTFDAMDAMIWAMRGGEQQADRLFDALQQLGGSSGSFETLGGGGADSIQTLAGGGGVRGAGTSTSDSILARLSNGEFVMKAKAVRKYGPALMHRINNLRFPGFADGGLAMPRMSAAVPSFAAAGGPSGRPFNLNIGGETFEGLIAPDTVADRMIQFATSRNVRQAGKKPSWYTGGK